MLALLQAPTSTHDPSLAGLRNRHPNHNPTGRETSPPLACRPRATPAPKTPPPGASSRVAALPGRHPPKPASPTRPPTVSGRPPAVGGDESQGVPLLASCHARIWTCAFAARASLLLNSNRLREQVCGRWKEVTSPGPPRGTPPRCKATWQDAGVSQVRGARRPQRRRAGSSDPKAHGGAPRSAPSPPSSLTARSRSSRSSPAPAPVRRPTEASAARRDPWARSDADWTPIEGPPDASQHAPTAPRNARLAREAASRAAQQHAEQAGPRPWLLDRTRAPPAIWTRRR